LISIRMNSPDMTGSYWMMDPLEGGGAILGEGCHFFDLMAWFTNAEPVSVFAKKLGIAQDALTSENNIACTISFDDGSVGSFVYETIGNRGLGSERIEISTGGTTVMAEDMKKLLIWNRTRARPKKEKSWKAEKGYYQALEAFVGGIIDESNSEEQAVAGARASLCALAALKSLETNLPERVECDY